MSKHVAGNAVKLTRNIVRAALSLEKDGIFKLLVAMTALLGWVMALGMAGSLMMQQVYSQWQLDRASTLSLYLPADAEAAKLAELEQSLGQLAGLQRAEIIPPAQVRAMIAPYVANPAELPLPVVIEVRVVDGSDDTDVRARLTQAVTSVFPTAEIDDSRPVLSAVAQGVRVMQAMGLGLALTMVCLMALLVSLTVRVGLKAQRATLNVLQHLGATDARLMREVAVQVTGRAMAGWLTSVVAASGVVLVSALLRPELYEVLNWQVWAGLAAAPLLLPVVALLVALLVAGVVLRNGANLR